MRLSEIEMIFVRMASAELTEWRALKDSVISVTGEEKENIMVFLKDSAPNLRRRFGSCREGDLIPESVLVIIKDFYPVRLRLVEKGHSVINDYLTKIEIETDSSQEYEVYALISTAVDSDGKCLRDENGKSLCDDPANWLKISVNWDLSSPLDQGISPPEPEYSERWTFNPIKPGEGTLKLKNTKDERTEELVLPVTVIRSPFSEVLIDLITPPNERIAGKTLKAVVKIKNRDGLVPGEYCFGNGKPHNDSAIYQDILPRGGDSRPKPTMTVDGVTKTLNTEDKTTYKHNQCFMDGIDTVEFVLYYATLSNRLLASDKCYSEWNKGQYRKIQNFIR